MRGKQKGHMTLGLTNLGPLTIFDVICHKTV